MGFDSPSKGATMLNTPPTDTRPDRTPKSTRLGVRRTLRRSELRELVPLGDTTIYEMEQRGEFPRRFHLSPRCVAWDMAEVEAWIAARRGDTAEGRSFAIAPHPDVRLRRARPVKG